jgi:hypothetical protein
MRVTLKKKKCSVLMILEPEERDMTGTIGGRLRWRGEMNFEEVRQSRKDNVDGEVDDDDEVDEVMMRDDDDDKHDGKEVDDRRWDETTLEEDDGGVWRSQGTVRYISCTRESRWRMIGGKNGEGRWVRKKIVGERRNGNVVMK